MTALAAGIRRTFERATQSTVNYWVVPIVDLTGAAALFLFGLQSPIDPVRGAALAVAGLALWPPIEYALHRWLGHGPASFARRGHAMHHADEEAPVAAPIFVVLACVIALWAALSAVTSPGAAALVMSGVYAGYNYYTLVHHALHHCEPLLVRIGAGRFVERHRIHHAQHDVNYGVTSTLCDRLFGTFRSDARPKGSARVQGFFKTNRS